MHLDPSTGTHKAPPGNALASLIDLFDLDSADPEIPSLQKKVSQNIQRESDLRDLIGIALLAFDTEKPYTDQLKGSTTNSNKTRQGRSNMRKYTSLPPTYPISAEDSHLERRGKKFATPRTSQPSNTSHQFLGVYYPPIPT